MAIFSANQRPNLFRLWLLFSVPWLCFFAYQAWIARADQAKLQQYSHQWLNTATQAKADYDQLKYLPDAQAIFQDEYELAHKMIAFNRKASDENAAMFDRSLQALIIPLALLAPILIKQFHRTTSQNE